MKIAIDDVIFQLQRNPRGVSRVWANILPYMKSMLEGENELLLLKREASRPINLGIPVHKIPSWSNHRADNDAKTLSSLCKKLGVDLFITTYHSKAPGIKSAVMVYDLIPEKRTWLAGCNEYVHRRDSYLNADTLICISENTRKELCEWYNMSTKRVETVLLGVSSQEFHPFGKNEQFRRKYNLPEDYFVLDGDISEKVANDFCNVFSSLSSKFTLLWYGGALKNYMIALCTKYKIPFRKVGWLPAGDVPLALANSKGLIYNSSAEGFGLPVLEAMACGTPVLCSSIDSLPEVGGDSVQYFADHSLECMKTALSSFLNPENRKLLGEKGFIRSQQFSWKKTAEEIVRIIT